MPIIGQSVDATNCPDVGSIGGMKVGTIFNLPRSTRWGVILKHGPAESLALALADGGGVKMGARFVVRAEEPAVEIAVGLLPHLASVRREAEVGAFLRVNVAPTAEVVSLPLPRGSMGFVELVCRAIGVAESRSREGQEGEEVEVPTAPGFVWQSIAEGLGRALERLRVAGVVAYKMTPQGLRVAILSDRPLRDLPHAADSLGSMATDAPPGPVGATEEQVAADLAELVEQAHPAEGPARKDN